MKKILLLTSLTLCSSLTFADDFPRLDEALPSNDVILGSEPVFDFDTDGCYPSAGISRDGKQNRGLKNSGPITGECRDPNFLETSNTLHRYACIDDQGDRYCGHFYALYFEKDQVVAGWDVFGHRNDWEHVVIWLKNGEITDAGYSAHGKLTNRSREQLPMQDNHVKFVYHKDGGLTHAMRFAKTNEIAENSYDYWVTPVITSWYELKGDTLANKEMRDRLNRFNYGKASIPMKDSNFLTNLNTYKPQSYPRFTQESIEASNPNRIFKQ